MSPTGPFNQRKLVSAVGIKVRVERVKESLDSRGKKFARSRI
jgi:hypothetical protein